MARIGCLLLGLIGFFANVHAARPAPPIDVVNSFAVEITPTPPPLALEHGMSGDVGAFYARAMTAVRNGQYRAAFSAVRQARVLAYQALLRGPTEHSLAQRHFTRILYSEEQLSELTLIDEQLEHPPEQLDQRNVLLQLRALCLHNLFLAVRGFWGINDARLMKEGLRAYKTVIDDADNLKQALIVAYAGLLAESGNLREARLTFAKVSEHDREQENLDIAVAYYYLALGDRQRAISRLLGASHRDIWLRSSPGREGRTWRFQVYRANDFDRLRDHVRFMELVASPEEK